MPVKITLIDDDLDDLEFLNSAILQADGNSMISTFTDVLVAKDLLENMEANNLPDLIIVDHQMPKMLGTELIEWIRSIDRFSGCSVVMYSTDTSHITSEQERLLNFRAIAKVNSYDGLLAVARELVALGKGEERSGR